MNANRIRTANSFNDFIKYTNSFSNGDMIWYRGHADKDYLLLPTLYRNKKVDFSKNLKTCYNGIHYAEDMRIQQYYAKNYQFIKNNGVNTTEWLGMAQHFGISTRFLDWSTSAIHALIFALDQYFDSKAEAKTKLPCVWLLKPQLMNQRIIQDIVHDHNLHKDFINLLNINDPIKKRRLIKFFTKISNDANIKNVLHQSNPANNWQNLDYIYDLAYFDRLLKGIKNDSVFDYKNSVNPLFLILAKAYIDGNTMNNSILESMPLAIIHPLNSDRITSQKGVFTIFPFPTEKEYIKNNSTDYMRMDLNKNMKGLLCKIEIADPYRVSEELKTLGIRKTWLFYEQDYISRDIENGL